MDYICWKWELSKLLRCQRHSIPAPVSVEYPHRRLLGFTLGIIGGGASKTRRSWRRVGCRNASVIAVHLSSADGNIRSQGLGSAENFTVSTEPIFRQLIAGTEELSADVRCVRLSAWHGPPK